jgi:hypothetical protein
MARPRFHLLLTAPLAWRAHHRWGPLAAAGALAAGVLIDADHLVDYALTRLRRERSHYVAPLHGWELAALVSALAAGAALARMVEATPDPGAPRLRFPGVEAAGHVAHRRWRRWLWAWAAGLALGWWLHLIQDVVSNRPRHPGVYSLLYRLRGGFRRELTGWGEHTSFHGWSDLPWYRWF